MRKLLILCFVIVVCAVGFLMFTRSSVVSPVNSPDPTQNSDSSVPETFAPTADTSALQANGTRYQDPDDVFSFLYPDDFTLDTSDPVHPRVYKQGAQQRPQSEMSNGALIVFEVVDLGTQSLEEMVDARIAQATADGTSQITQAKRAATLNGYPGFTYQIRGLGESTNLIVQQNAAFSQALIITYLVADPENQGYQSEVDAILATVSFGE